MIRRLALLALLAGVLAFVRAAGAGPLDDGLPFHIHTVTLASGKTTRLTSGRVQDLLPAWQPA